MGSDAFAVPSLESLARIHEVIAVVTQPDKPAGRAKILAPTPLKLSAEKLGLKILQPLRCRDETFIRELRALAPETIVVVAYGQILPKEILTLPPRGCINVHASLLPRWRGASPVAHAILNGDTVTGVTTMMMDEGLDTGPILLQREETIFSADTTANLETRLAKIGAELLLETPAHSPSPNPQDNAKSTHAPKLKKEDGRIDWSLTAEQIERRVRAFNPWPTAFTFAGKTRLQIWSAKVLPENGSAGIVARADKGGITVGTGEGILLITELQREGSRRMAAAEFLRGFRLEVGQRLGAEK